jgi:hypothetical protein
MKVMTLTNSSLLVRKYNWCGLAINEKWNILCKSKKKHCLIKAWRPNWYRFKENNQKPYRNAIIHKAYRQSNETKTDTIEDYFTRGIAGLKIAIPTKMDTALFKTYERKLAEKIIKN